MSRLRITDNEYIYIHISKYIHIYVYILPDDGQRIPDSGYRIPDFGPKKDRKGATVSQGPSQNTPRVTGLLKNVSIFGKTKTIKMQSNKP